MTELSGKKTILLVEDEAITAMVEQKQLEERGYDVIHIFSDGVISTDTNGNVDMMNGVAERFPDSDGLQR
jgi:signal transduction histidine kinase